MHLTGEADGADVVATKTRLRERLTDTCADAMPPIGRILLAPLWLWLTDWLRGIGDSDDITRCINDQRFGAGGADIESHQVGHDVTFL